jgi:hypothetical protein
MTPVHGASSKQGHDMEPSPSPLASRHEDVFITIYETSRTRLQEEEGGTALGLSPPLFFSFLYSSLSLSYPRSFPWLIKGKTRRPISGSSFWSPSFLGEAFLDN